MIAPYKKKITAETSSRTLEHLAKDAARRALEYIKTLEAIRNGTHKSNPPETVVLSDSLASETDEETLKLLPSAHRSQREDWYKRNRKKPYMSDDDIFDS